MEHRDEVPWVEKYRPQRLDDLITRSKVVETLKRLTGPSNFPHLLLFGPPGTGKTSAILAVARTLYGENLRKKVLELNASDERGIAVVRENIKECVTSFSLIQEGVPFKLVILDECDNMTKVAQMSLRRVMETSTKHVRFCLMCNHPNQLLPAIRSRCAQLRFQPLEPERVKERLLGVIQQEGMEVESAALEALIKVARGDLRLSLNTLQFLCMTGECVGETDVYRALGHPAASDVEDLQYHLLNSSLAEAFDFISTLCSREVTLRKTEGRGVGAVSQGYALVDLMQEVAINLAEEAFLPQDTIIRLMEKMGDNEQRLAGAANETLQLLGWIGSFIKEREMIMHCAR